MAFTPSPELNTYTTKRIPLAYAMQLPPANNNINTLSIVSDKQGAGPGMINILPVKEKNSEDLIGITRPAISSILFQGTAVPTDPVPAQGIVRGLYAWDTGSAKYVFVVVDTRVYAISITSISLPTSTSWVFLTAITNTNITPCRFTEFIDSTNVKSLILATGTELFSISTGLVVTNVADPDLPNPHIPFPVFLNGRLYLAKEATGDIYNSALDDPTSWAAGDFISTETYPDNVQALVKINNYILAIGNQGSEYFYDAANATGTPLARMEGQLLPFGTLFPNSIASSKATCTFLANNSDGQAVFITIDGFKYATIPADGVISDYYAHLTNPAAAYASFATAAAASRGNYFRHDGLLYYSFLTDGTKVGNNALPGIVPCYVYSFDAKAWCEFQLGESANRTSRWGCPIYFTCEAMIGTMTTYVAGNAGVSGYAFWGELRDDRGYDQFSVNSGSYSFLHQQYQEVRTPMLNFDTMNRKFLYRIIMAVENGDATWNNSAIKVSYNDFNYDTAKWSTDVSSTADSSSIDWVQQVTQLGAFRRRAFRFYQNDGKVKIWRWAELEMNRSVS